MNTRPNDKQYGTAAGQTFIRRVGQLRIQSDTGQQIYIQIDVELPGESRVGTIHFQLFRA
jgi:hypothetical protein